MPDCLFREEAAFGVDGAECHGKGGEGGWIAGGIEAVGEGVAVAGLGAAATGNQRRGEGRWRKE
jgi:hypothetical protein